MLITVVILCIVSVVFIGIHLEHHESIKGLEQRVTDIETRRRQ